MKRFTWIALAVLLCVGPSQAQMSPLPGGGEMVRIGPAVAIAKLPPVYQTTGQLFLVNDAATGSDCTTGASTTKVLCYSTGAAYEAMTTAGAVGDSPTYVGITLSGLTASKPVGTDGSKALVSLTTTGSGASVLATTPTLVTPVLGVATGTSLAVTGSITSSSATDLGWSVVAGANTACNTTCTSACVFGFDSGGTPPTLVACSSALADICACAGAS